MKLFCPECSTTDPIVKRIAGIDRKSWKRHIAEILLSWIPLVGSLIFVGTTITDLKDYDMLICGNCNHKWDVKK